MSYDDEVAKVCRVQNGWTVEIFDPSPAEEKADKKAQDKGMFVGSYRSGWRSFAFTTEKELLAFLGKKLPSLNPRNFDEAYQAAFDAGVESEMPTKRGRQ